MVRNTNLSRFMRFKLTILILFGTSLAHGALPVGIPDPAGKVPAAIMPVLPAAGEQIDGFPYDPINRATPTWNDGASQYYIDSTASNCDDAANGGRGNMTTPRCTLPGMNNTSWTLNAGDQLFVAGNGATYGGARDLNSVDMPGTATNPIWIIGMGAIKPEFRLSRFYWNQGRHVFFDSVHFRSPTDDFRMIWYNATGPVEYFTFRHVACSGSDGTHSDPSRRCFSLGGTENNINRFIVFYDLDIWGLGRWQDDRNTSRDMLGIQLQKWTRYVWLINSRIRHIQGDSIMCGNSNWWDFNRASRPHYLYIGGNEFYENYENGYDQKGCYHVVVSENHIHDFYNAYKPANSTAVITEQDSEGDVGGRFSWFINNLIENAGTAVRSSATTDDAYIYVLSNMIRNVDTAALAFTQRCYSGGSGGTTCPLGATFANNTIDCNLKGTGITNLQNPIGSDQHVEVDGNIFYNCTDGSEHSDQNWESFSVDPLYIKHVNNVHYRTSGGDIAINTGRYDEFSGNILNSDVRFSATGVPYDLQETSPAAKLIGEPNSAYALFESMYGLDIRMDRLGNTWAAGDTINAGANQGGSGGSMQNAPPSPPVLLVN
jgi:hypothetical protein